jgi:hypothetical protein
MIEVSQLTALIVGETLVGLLVLSGVLVLLVILRKGRIRKAAHHLAERVQSDKEKRTERLKALLAEKYGYEGSGLDQALHNITQTEMRLYQNIINGFLKDDQIFLQQVDVDVENLVLSYQGLNTPQGSSSEVVQVSDDSDTVEEIKHLREENERLSDELKVTMDTMGRMLNEYSTMFAGGSAETFEKVAEEATPEPEPVAEISPEPVPESPEEEVSPEPVPEPPVEAPSPEPIAESSSPEPEEPVAEIEEIIEAEVSQEEAVSAVDEPVAVDPINTDSSIDIDIPDFQPSDDLMQGSDLYEPSADDLDGAASAVDDDVSEIIDEVMEIADEISANDKSGSSAGEAGGVTESLMDEVAQVDIEIPDMESVAPTPEESEAASLEEEWAKLLEEDAASEDEKKDQ